MDGLYRCRSPRIMIIAAREAAVILFKVNNTANQT